MNKHDVIVKIAKDTGITKTSAAAAVDSLIDGITKSLRKGDSVSFVGFGTFKTAQRKAREQFRVRLLLAGTQTRELIGFARGNRPDQELEIELAGDERLRLAARICERAAVREERRDRR